MAERKRLPELSCGTFCPHGRGGGKVALISRGLSKELVVVPPSLSSSCVCVSAPGGSAALVSDQGRVLNMTRSLSLSALYWFEPGEHTQGSL